MFTGYNWVGILFWIVAIVYTIWVIHFIRVKQLMLIIQTQKSFNMGHFLKYVGLLIVAIGFLGSMAWFTFFRPVDMTDKTDVDISTKYHALQLQQFGDEFYYVNAKKSQSGKQPVVSYSYWADDNKTTISSRNGTVSRGTNAINMDASIYPWDQKKVESEDLKTAHSFSAEMTIKYKKSFLNGLGVRSGHVAGYYTLIRIPSISFIHSEVQK